MKAVCPRGGTLNKLRATSLALATWRMRVCRLTGVAQTYLRPGLGARIFSLRVISSSGLSRYILSTKHTDLVMDEAGASLWSHHLPPCYPHAHPRIHSNDPRFFTHRRAARADIFNARQLRKAEQLCSDMKRDYNIQARALPSVPMPREWSPNQGPRNAQADCLLRPILSPT